MKNLLFLILLCFGVNTNAQSELWSKKVSKDAFFSQLEDGTILLNEKTKISLLDNKTGEKKWEIDIATKDEPEFLDDLPIMFFEGDSYAVIDARTGFVIDRSPVKTKILSISYFWELGRVVLELKRNKKLHVLNIDLKSLSSSWNTKVGPAKKKSLDLYYRTSENPPEISNDGSLVVIDKKYISFLNLDGTIKQQLEFNNNLQTVGFNQEQSILYILEDKKRLHFVDVTFGTASVFIALKDDDIKLKILGAGTNISFVQGNEISVINGVNASDIDNHFFEDKIRVAYVDEESGRLFVLTHKTLAEIDHSTGKVLKSLSFKNKFKDIYNIYGKTIVSGSSGACPIDLATFKFEYPKIPDIPKITDFVEMGNYIGYIYFVEGKFELNVVDKNGDIVWDKSYLPINPPSLDVIEDGLLIVSESEVAYVSIEDGKSIWNDKVKVDPSFTYGIDELTNDLYMYSGKRIYKFDYSSGTLAKSVDKFKFKDFDYETLKPQLFVLPDAIFMKGSNTVIVLEKDGTLKHKISYSRISTGSTILQLATVIVTAAAIGTGNTQELVTVYADHGIVSQGGLVDALDASWELGEWMDYNRRAKQNRSSNMFPYVFTKLEGGKRGLIFINPTDGAERFSIELDKKNPSYVVDDVDGILFHLSEDSLTAYDLK